MSINSSRPPYTALNAQPMSPEEIDANKDRDRIWATIIEIWESHQRELTESYWSGYYDARGNQEFD